MSIIYWRRDSNMDDRHEYDLISDDLDTELIIALRYKFH